MAANLASTIAKMVEINEASILADWLRLVAANTRKSAGRIEEAELKEQARGFLQSFRQALAQGNVTDAGGPEYQRAREVLGEMSRARARQGFTPTETATFVFSLKEPLFRQLQTTFTGDAKGIAEGTWILTLLLDQLGLHSMEVFQQSREEIINRQTREISELSTPVVKLWDKVVALPLIGTLDSERTATVMENLLERLVKENTEIAIIDITGVPTVDTLVAQHLLKTVSAARLMGADCIISGIRPQIAQTMIHLGVELNVISKASLADAFVVALQRVGQLGAVQKMAARQ